jgi:FtsP/CotA-like multicopper oxidase with cupredoxin domain
MKRKFLVLTLLFVVSLTLTLAATTQAQSSGTSITLYAGSVTSGSGPYGYGNNANNIISPGPTLNLQVGTTYTITVNNVGNNIFHSFEIVSSKAVSSSPLFGAGIDITSYISPGSSGSVTFTPDQAGNFYYVCTVPGHIDLGMWGNVVVSTAVPEFPSALVLTFLALAITVVVVFLAATKNFKH